MMWLIFLMVWIMVLDIVGSFFFQAEDGIRDYKVTGVQTCALPISPQPASYGKRHPEPQDAVFRMKPVGAQAAREVSGIEELPGKSNYFLGNDPSKRSEERRVGKECRSRWSPYH